MLSQVPSVDLVNARPKPLLPCGPFVSEHYAHKLPFNSHFILNQGLLIELSNNLQKQFQPDKSDKILGSLLQLPGHNILIDNCEPSLLEVLPPPLFFDSDLSDQVLVT